jgi:hypothetical protein
LLSPKYSFFLRFDTAIIVITIAVIIRTPPTMKYIAKVQIQIFQKSFEYLPNKKM